MSVSYFVRYEIAVPDLKAFVERYRTLHVPLVTAWPGLQRMVIHTPAGWNDPFPVNRGKAVLMAQLEFETEEAMNQAFASRERAEAREDFKRFMTFEGSVIHQAMRSEEVWRSPWLDGNEEQA
ncbi:MAG TPA: EthD family reductase [Burkholderiales bacterium]|nr:EthD family reductase [Burkholderiales bacterium]